MAPLLIAALVLAGLGAIITGFVTAGAVFLTGAAICAMLAGIRADMVCAIAED